jgi:hypothetical protein
VGGELDWDLGYMPDKTISLFPSLLFALATSRENNFEQSGPFPEFYFHAKDIESGTCILQARDCDILPCTYILGITNAYAMKMRNAVMGFGIPLRGGFARVSELCSQAHTYRW